ncbi:MAG TPA: HEAT repeat domain-containing protein [Gemmatimonadaceae bacterium]|jgi:HEAT repeat protein|nr:HEAT repeat domain-containing protein [Gemmatimonadaceae bacterium]
MLRTAGFVIAGVFIALATEGGPARVSASMQVAASERGVTMAAQDVASVLSAARGVSPIMCSLAAQSVWGGGWGWYDAPSSPIGAEVSMRIRELGRQRLASSDVRLVMDSLASGDACVREMSVRLLARQRNEGGQRDETVVSGLVERLGSQSPELREVAALGLGFMHPRSAVEPLIRALRDDMPGVRANSAWALGHIEDGRALRPLVDLLADTEPRVRDAAAVAVGRIDSLSSVEALVRVVREDTSPSVRRSAAWALGQLEARGAVDVLIAVLRQDADPRVREMAAWALGSMETRSAAPGLIGALRRDSSDAVRETAAWALGSVGDDTAVDILGDAIRTDRSPRVRGTAAWALGQLDPRAAPRGLIDGLSDQEDDVRLKAAWALGQIGDSTAVSAIQGALKVEKHERARRAQIRALLKSGGRSEALLTELLSSGEPEVREAAIRGLAGRSAFNPWPWPWPRPRPTP